MAYSSKTTTVEDRNKKNINQEPETNEGDIADVDIEKNVESEQQHKAKTRDETEVKKTKRRRKVNHR